MKHRFLAIICAATIAGCSTTSGTGWHKIGNGPPLEYAEAQCNIASMGAEQRRLAIGSPAFVGGAMVGGAIRNAIRRAEYKRNCMILQGWKQAPKT